MNSTVCGFVRLLVSLMVAAMIFSCINVAEAGYRRITLADLGIRAGLASPALSPDGKRLVVVVSRVNYDENRFERSLVLVDALTGARRILSIDSSNVSYPQWSPGGDQLAWLGTTDGGLPQIYSLSAREIGARPVRLTNIPTGVLSFAWQPKGSTIAFLSPEPREVLPGEERHNRSFEVVDNDHLATEAPVSSHVWLVPADGGELRRLTSGVESVTGIGWLRDGHSIIYASQPRAHNSPTDFAEFVHLSSKSNAVTTIDVLSGSRHVVVPDASIVSAPKLSPTEDLIAYLRFRGPEPWTHPQNVAVVSATGGEVRDVTAALDRDVREFVWLPAGDALVVTAPNGTRQALWVQPLAGPARELAAGAVTEIHGLTVSASGSLAFVGSEPQLPPEIYVMTTISDKPRRLTHFNDELATRQLGRSETVKWQNDGFEETGVLILPPGFKTRQKVPLVLNIHGGPEGTSTEAFDLFDQILAARGWAVFKPNYRGSNSQGDVFESAVINDLGEGPGRDVMAGIAALKARGFVDENRIAVSGWSYGGYMTVWLIGHFQGWRAAVAGAALVNYLDWYNLSCCNAWADAVLGGSPWLHENAARYWQQSPIAYADRIRTPTLILAHLRDPEVPVSQSYNLYHALRDNNVPVKFVMYPLEGHTISLDPVHERDTYRRWLGWIDDHFRAPIPQNGR